MTARTFFCSLLMLVGVATLAPADAEAQYSRRGYEGGARDADAYAANDSRLEARDRRLSRRDRQRLQGRLEARDRRLQDYAFELEQRAARLDGRRATYQRRPSRYRLPDRLLDRRELAAYGERLDRRALRLEARDRDLERLERRRGRRSTRARTTRGTRRGDTRGGRSGGGGNYCPPSW